MAVESFLGRVLSPDGTAAGTCFQAAPGVLVTAWRVLADAGAGDIGATALVEPLAPGEFAPTPGRVVRIDPVHDLAAIEVAGGALGGVVEGFAATGDQALSTPVSVTGAAPAKETEAASEETNENDKDGFPIERHPSQPLAAQ